MSIKAKIEAIVYAAEEPVTIDQVLAVLADEIAAEQHAESCPPLEAMEHNASDVNDGRALADAKHEAKQQRDLGRKRVREILEQLTAEYDAPAHGMEIRQVAGGYRMSTKPEHHDVVRSFARSLKPPVRLSLQALETLAVIAYKQPVTGPEISEIRGVDSSGVLANLISRKLITTAGRKQVIGRPILYKTTKDFLMRFGLKDLSELPSIEEFEKLTSAAQSDLFNAEEVRSDPTGVSDVPVEHEEAEQATVTADRAETAESSQIE
ncbi:MAG: SMC-Scp complex subunit ScpB [Acidobacteria bacterium]|nr:SMC-Scp complex subunit ScpB [Acidobacteriota bacterium]MBV9145054.1 SMC-Scp complex subunit ScpB [Acidobacteriota bacterium]